MKTSIKTCFKCGIEKLIDEFYRHSAMADGHLGKCKSCAKSDVKKHRLENIESLRAYERARAGTTKRREMAKAIGAAWRAKYPERRRAQVMLNNAIRDGRIKAMPCFICGGKAEAHHPNYDSPLDVVWLCPIHHKQAHAMVCTYSSIKG